MAAKGYCTAANVADFLGVTLTAGQQTYALALLETVELLIDGETGRGWLEGAQTDETFRPADWPDGLIYLVYTPVNTTVALVVEGREAWDGDDAALVEDTDYEVIDGAGGVLRLIDPYQWARITVDYTPVATVPAPVRDAAAEWVGILMQPVLNGTAGMAGVEAFTLPDLSIKFAKGGAAGSGEIPSTVALKLSAVDAYPSLPGMS